MKKNNKGFTLVELLAAIVILGLLVFIGLPRILDALGSGKSNLYISDAKKMISQAEYKIKVSNASIEIPDDGDCIAVSLLYLDSSEFSVAPNNGEYLDDKSYVLVKNNRGKLEYSVASVEKFKDGKGYKGVKLSTTGALSANGIARVDNYKEEDLVSVSDSTKFNTEYINEKLNSPNYCMNVKVYNKLDLDNSSLTDGINHPPTITKAIFTSASGKAYNSLDAKLSIKVVDKDFDKDLTVYTSLISYDDAYRNENAIHTDGEIDIDYDFSQIPFSCDYNSTNRCKFDANECSSVTNPYVSACEYDVFIVAKDSNGAISKKMVTYEIHKNEAPVINEQATSIISDSVLLQMNANTIITLNVSDDIDDDLDVCIEEKHDGSCSNTNNYFRYSSLFSNNQANYTLHVDDNFDGNTYPVTIFVKDRYGATSSIDLSYTLSKYLNGNLPVIQENDYLRFEDRLNKNQGKGSMAVSVIIDDLGLFDSCSSASSRYVRIWEENNGVKYSYRYNVVNGTYNPDTAKCYYDTSTKKTSCPYLFGFKNNNPVGVKIEDGNYTGSNYENNGYDGSTKKVYIKAYCKSITADDNNNNYCSSHYTNDNYNSDNCHVRQADYTVYQNKKPDLYAYDSEPRLNYYDSRHYGYDVCHFSQVPCGRNSIYSRYNFAIMEDLDIYKDFSESVPTMKLDQNMKYCVSESYNDCVGENAVWNNISTLQFFRASSPLFSVDPLQYRFVYMHHGGVFDYASADNTHPYDGSTRKLYIFVKDTYGEVKSIATPDYVLYENKAPEIDGLDVISSVAGSTRVRVSPVINNDAQLFDGVYYADDLDENLIYHDFSTGVNLNPGEFALYVNGIPITDDAYQDSLYGTNLNGANGWVNNIQSIELADYGFKNNGNIVKFLFVMKDSYGAESRYETSYQLGVNTPPKINRFSIVDSEKACVGCDGGGSSVKVKVELEDDYDFASESIGDYGLRVCLTDDLEMVGSDSCYVNYSFFKDKEYKYTFSDAKDPLRYNGQEKVLYLRARDSEGLFDEDTITYKYYSNKSPEMTGPSSITSANSEYNVDTIYFNTNVKDDLGDLFEKVCYRTVTYGEEGEKIIGEDICPTDYEPYNHKFKYKIPNAFTYEGQEYEMYAYIKDRYGATIATETVNYKISESVTPKIKNIVANKTFGSPNSSVSFETDGTVFGSYRICVKPATEAKTCTNVQGSVFAIDSGLSYKLDFNAADFNKKYNLIVMPSDATSTTGVAYEFKISNDLECSRSRLDPYNKIVRYELAPRSYAGNNYDALTGESSSVQFNNNKAITMDRCQGRCYYWDATSKGKTHINASDTSSILGYYKKTITYNDRITGSQCLGNNKLSVMYEKVGCGFYTCFNNGENYVNTAIGLVEHYSDQSWTYDGNVYGPGSVYYMVYSTSKNADGSITLTPDVNLKVPIDKINDFTYDKYDSINHRYIRVLDDENADLTDSVLKKMRDSSVTIKRKNINGYQAGDEICFGSDDCFYVVYADIASNTLTLISKYNIHSGVYWDISNNYFTFSGSEFAERQYEGADGVYVGGFNSVRLEGETVTDLIDGYINYLNKNIIQVRNPRMPNMSDLSYLGCGLSSCTPVVSLDNMATWVATRPGSSSYYILYNNHYYEGDYQETKYISGNAGIRLVFDIDIADIDFRRDYLLSDNSSDSAFENNKPGGSIKKNDVEAIYTYSDIDALSENLGPSFADAYVWDVSRNGNNSILAYAVDLDSNGKYEIHLYQQGGVKANPDSSKLFSNFSNLSTIDVSHLVTDDVLDFEGMFKDDKLLSTIVGLDKLNTSNVLNFNSMFENCKNLTTIDVSNFDTSSATTMSKMFYNATALKSLDVSGFSLTGVNDISYMFAASGQSGFINMNLEEIKGLESWNATNVENMEGVFRKNRKIETLNIGGWNVSSVTNLSYMFDSCENLTSIYLTKWNTSNVTTLEQTFANLNNVSVIEFGSNWNCGNVQNFKGTFKNSSFDDWSFLSRFNVSKGEDFTSTFEDSNLPSFINVGDWNVSNATTLKYMFKNCVELGPTSYNDNTFAVLRSWDVRNVDDFTETFYGCKNLKVIRPPVLLPWTVKSDASFDKMFGNIDSSFPSNLEPFPNVGGTWNNEGTFVPNSQ